VPVNFFKKMSKKDFIRFSAIIIVIILLASGAIFYHKKEEITESFANLTGAVMEACSDSDSFPAIFKKTEYNPVADNSCTHCADSALTM